MEKMSLKDYSHLVCIDYSLVYMAMKMFGTLSKWRKNTEYNRSEIDSAVMKYCAKRHNDLAGKLEYYDSVISKVING